MCVGICHLYETRVILKCVSVICLRVDNCFEKFSELNNPKFAISVCIRKFALVTDIKVIHHKIHNDMTSNLNERDKY